MIVLIPAAGLGARLKPLEYDIHKTLLPIGKLPAISRIILSYPSNFKFIILTGFMRNILVDYLKISHSNLNIKFVKIPIFSGYTWENKTDCTIK
jgi:NDP-sugar pyrophosphorylase family protein